MIKDCYLFSASCYVKINQFESAILLMNELLDVEKNNVKALYLRGKAYFHKGQMKEAGKDFSRALKIDPSNTIILNYYSQIRPMIKDDSSHDGS